MEEERKKRKGKPPSLLRTEALGFEDTTGLYFQTHCQLFPLTEGADTGEASI